MHRHCASPIHYLQIQKSIYKGLGKPIFLILEFDWIAFLRLILLNSNWMANPKLNWTKRNFATEFAKSRLNGEFSTELDFWTYPPAESPKTTEFAFLRLKLNKTNRLLNRRAEWKKMGSNGFGFFSNGNWETRPL